MQNNPWESDTNGLSTLSSFYTEEIQRQTQTTKILYIYSMEDYKRYENKNSPIPCSKHAEQKQVLEETRSFQCDQLNSILFGSTDED